MAKKRGQNEGTIRKRKDGSWEARVTVGIDANGKQIRKSLYGKTKKVAFEKMTDLQNNLQKGIISNPTEITLGEWLDKYMLDYKKPFVKPTTYLNYSVKVNNHIKPAIGHYKLKSLRQDIVQNFIKGLIEKGLSPSTVIDIYKMLHNALEIAVDDGLIVRNVSDRVKLPKAPKPNVPPLSPEQQTAFVEQAKKTYMGKMYIFALFTGLRQGELMGLQWKDIDENDELHVTRTLRKTIDPDDKNDKWHLEFGDPKTDASKRTIPLNNTALAIIGDVWVEQQEYKAKAGAAYEDNDLVFCTQLGRPLAPNNMLRTFYKIRDQIGLSKDYHPHCLRHTFATNGVDNEMDMRVLQALMGHASIQETVDIYTRVSDDSKRREIKKLENTVKY